MAQRAVSDTGILLAILGLVLAGNLANDVVITVNLQRTAPTCARHGWTTIQTGLFQYPMCLDVDTGLVHVPPEIR